MLTAGRALHEGEVANAILVKREGLVPAVLARDEGHHVVGHVRAFEG
jgi:hypothetical protein